MNRCLVFSVPVRNKIEGSILYRGKPKRYSYSRAEEIWIINCGQLCKEQFVAGTHAWVADSFELDESGLNLWDDFKDLPQFAMLKEFVQSVDGEVVTQIVRSDSLLAVDDDYEIGAVPIALPKD